MYFDKTLFTKTSGRPDLAYVIYFCFKKKGVVVK